MSEHGTSDSRPTREDDGIKLFIRLSGGSVDVNEIEHTFRKFGTISRIQDFKDKVLTACMVIISFRLFSSMLDVGGGPFTALQFPLRID